MKAERRGGTPVAHRPTGATKASRPVYLGIAVASGSVTLASGRDCSSREGGDTPCYTRRVHDTAAASLRKTFHFSPPTIPPAATHCALIFPDGNINIQRLSPNDLPAITGRRKRWAGKEKKTIYITHPQTERGEMKRNGCAASPQLRMGADKVGVVAAGVGGVGGDAGARLMLLQS